MIVAIATTPYYSLVALLCDLVRVCHNFKSVPLFDVLRPNRPPPPTWPHSPSFVLIQLGEGGIPLEGGGLFGTISCGISGDTPLHQQTQLFPYFIDQAKQGPLGGGERRTKDVMQVLFFFHSQTNQFDACFKFYQHLTHFEANFVWIRSFFEVAFT